MKNNLKRIALLTIATILSACETLPTAPEPVPAADPLITSHTPTASIDKIKQANAFYRQGKKRLAANAYFAAGKDSPPPEKERLMLQAIEVAAMIPDTQLMQQYFSAINTSRLDTNNRARYNYGKALLALIKNQPTIALDILPTDVSRIDPALANKILLTRLRAADKTKNHLRMAEERIRQHSHLKKPNNRSNNIKKIWQNLSKVPAQTIDQKRKNTRNSVFRGWFDLAYIDKVSSDNVTRANNLTQWRKHFPNHPAITVNQRLSGHSVTTNNTPISTGSVVDSVGKNIAVLLPFSGHMGNVGNNLLRGIKVAHQQYSSGTALRSYDTSQVDATVVYNQALQQGAEFILGPFSKQNIASMARNGYLQKPALSLNYLPSTERHPNNLYQIGLLPEDEALQVATLATSNGQKRALLMVPDSQWGKRLESSFSAAYRSRSGEIVKVVRYPNRATNYSHHVSDLMNAASSADMIFIAASPTQARLIYPAITQNQSSHENKLPVYATSHIYSGRPSPSLDSNLNGIIYTEIPSILSSPNDPSQQYPRLFALGEDAFIISQKLKALKQGASIKGKTGTISYSPDGRLHRVLEWATFRNGVPTSYVP